MTGPIIPLADSIETLHYPLMITVSLISVLQDNYAYLLESENGAVGVVDPGHPRRIYDVLEHRRLTPGTIFNTHHHGDHTGGNLALKNAYGAIVIGPAGEEERIPDMDLGVSEGESLEFGGESVEILSTPGHTRHHICFWFPKSGILFSGDTLFAMGCGRIFEGSAADMWNSLMKIRALPEDTVIYCGHEYTLANGRFCLGIEPDNADLKARIRAAEKLRANDRPTLPTTLAEELRTNAFLRADLPEVKKALGMEASYPVDVFTEIRARKDAA